MSLQARSIQRQKTSPSPQPHLLQRRRTLQKKPSPLRLLSQHRHRKTKTTISPPNKAQMSLLPPKSQAMPILGGGVVSWIRWGPTRCLSMKPSQATTNCSPFWMMPSKACKRRNRIKINRNRSYAVEKGNPETSAHCRGVWHTPLTENAAFFALNCVSPIEILGMKIHVGILSEFLEHPCNLFCGRRHTGWVRWAGSVWFVLEGLGLVRGEAFGVDLLV